MLFMYTPLKGGGTPLHVVGTVGTQGIFKGDRLLEKVNTLKEMSSVRGLGIHPPGRRTNYMASLGHPPLREPKSVAQALQ